MTRNKVDEINIQDGHDGSGARQSSQEEEEEITMDTDLPVQVEPPVGASLLAG
eukprot:CAMPEP_0119551428 /NCGR_PEP_ID=MMETSP1352-20130426/4694_1 /TAXON_ID=265584 /ORGANISM="Stauroneis constricta, Strain CCMP1120" /LENGTH=52 /DNA_ID=CAMNT_0007597487 /DNA_START=3 /DNA_END=157 /DNA_ORIENTATION=+